MSHSCHFQTFMMRRTNSASRPQADRVLLARLAFLAGVGIGASRLLLWLDMRRRMMVCDAPFPIALHNQHGEARWGGYRLALLHPCELVKSRYHYSIIPKHDCASIA